MRLAVLAAAERSASSSLDAAMLDEHHSLIKLHAQTLCTFAEPKCEGCPLLQLCPTGKRNMAHLQLTPPVAAETP